MLEAAEEDILAFYAFPLDHRRKIRLTTAARSARPTRWSASTRDIGRRTVVVGIFPDDASLIRLASMIAIEANDEWLVGRAYMTHHTLEALRNRGASPTTPIKEVKELQAA